MEIVNVSGLKNNPTEALRKSHHDVVLVIAHLSRLGIAAVRLDAKEAARDMDTLEQWLALS